MSKSSSSLSDDNTHDAEETKENKLAEDKMDEIILLKPIKQEVSESESVDKRSDPRVKQRIEKQSQMSSATMKMQSKSEKDESDSSSKISEKTKQQEKKSHPEAEAPATIESLFMNHPYSIVEAQKPKPKKVVNSSQSRNQDHLQLSIEQVRNVFKTINGEKPLTEKQKHSLFTPRGLIGRRKILLQQVQETMQPRKEMPKFKANKKSQIIVRNLKGDTKPGQEFFILTNGVKPSKLVSSREFPIV